MQNIQYIIMILHTCAACGSPSVSETGAVFCIILWVLQGVTFKKSENSQNELKITN